MPSISLTPAHSNGLRLLLDGLDRDSGEMPVCVDASRSGAEGLGGMIFREICKLLERGDLASAIASSRAGRGLVPGAAEFSLLEALARRRGMRAHESGGWLDDLLDAWADVGHPTSFELVRGQGPEELMLQETPRTESIVLSLMAANRRTADAFTRAGMAASQKAAGTVHKLWFAALLRDATSAEARKSCLADAMVLAPEPLVLLHRRAKQSLALHPGDPQVLTLLARVGERFSASRTAVHRLVAHAIWKQSAEAAGSDAIAELEAGLWQVRRVTDPENRLSLDWPIEQLGIEVCDAVAADEWGLLERTVFPPAANH